MRVKKNLIYWLVLALVLGFSFKATMSRSLSFHFVDEEDHMVGGDYMNQGLKLYQDISTNHQPLVYVGSSLIQKLTKPQSMLMLIKRHRQAIYVFSLFWGVILLWRFKTVGLAVFGLLEMTKYFWLGNLWLMESLALYPLIYILGTVLELIFEKKKYKMSEVIILGLSSFLVIFNLVPLWPWLLVIWLIIFFKDRKSVMTMLGTVAVLTLILMIFVSPLAWFREVVWNNYIYAIPKLVEIKTLTDWLRLGVFPFQAFLNLNPLINQIIALLLLGWLGASWLTKTKIIWVYGLLFLANNRVLHTDGAYYSGFHLLPWIGLFMFASLYWVKKAWGNLGVGIMALLMLVLVNKSSPWFYKTDLAEQYHINYSTMEDINFVIKTLASSGDRLAGLTSEPLVYWQTNTLPATKQIVYYAWQSEVPKLKSQSDYVFSQNQPEFIYGGNKTEMAEKNYVNVSKNNQEIELYVHQEKVDKLSQNQLETINNRQFKLITN